MLEFQKGAEKKKTKFEYGVFKINPKAVESVMQKMLQHRIKKPRRKSFLDPKVEVEEQSPSQKPVKKSKKSVKKGRRRRLPQAKVRRRKLAKILKHLVERNST